MKKLLALAIVGALSGLTTAPALAATATDSLKITWTVAATGSIKAFPSFGAAGTAATPGGPVTPGANALASAQGAVAAGATSWCSTPAAPTPNTGPNTAVIDFGTVTPSTTVTTECDYPNAVAVQVTTNSTAWNVTEKVTGTALPAGYKLCALPATNAAVFPPAMISGATALPQSTWTSANVAANASLSAGNCPAPGTPGGADLTTATVTLIPAQITGVTNGAVGQDMALIFPANAAAGAQNTTVTFTLTF